MGTIGLWQLAQGGTARPQLAEVAAVGPAGYVMLDQIAPEREATGLRRLLLAADDPT